jgi:hypothetical protein
MSCGDKYKFWKWLIEKAMSNKRVYRLLWGFLFVLAICAFKFGLLGLF